MKGGVRQRGLTLSYYFDLGIVDGKRKKKEKGGFRTKGGSEKALRKAMKVALFQKIFKKDLDIAK